MYGAWASSLGDLTDSRKAALVCDSVSIRAPIL